MIIPKPRLLSIVISVITITGFTSSCTQTNPQTYIQHLDGYWEIKKVITPTGEEKQYTFNQSIDYIKINDSIGIRKKLQPRLDGSFLSTKDAEQFTYAIENDSLRLFYKTALASWKETIVKAKENELIVKNETGNLYFYKRYQKLEL